MFSRFSSFSASSPLPPLHHNGKGSTSIRVITQPAVNNTVNLLRIYMLLSSPAEKATNPKNKYEDWEFIMAFCDKVNAEAEG